MGFKMKYLDTKDVFETTLENNFLENRLQRVVLNLKTSLWELVLAVVLHEYILGPCLFQFT